MIGQKFLSFVLIPSLTGILFCFCSLQTKTVELGYIEVEAEGENLQDAEKNSKIEMIRQVIGTDVESRSYLLDSASLGNVVETSDVGLVRRYRILESKYSKNGIYLKASGIVDEKRLEESIQEQYKLLGKPRILLAVSERFGNAKSNLEKTLIESKLVALYPRFDFIRLKSDKINSLNKTEEVAEVSTDSLLELARKNGGELLWTVDFVSKEGGPVAEGTELKSIFASLDFKLIEIVSGRILVSGNLQDGKPAINLQYGSEKAIDRLLSEMKPSLIKQLSEKWKRGNTIRIVFENLSFEEYSKADVAQWIRNIRGVNSLNERGLDSQGRMVLEVSALLDGGKLFSILKKGEDRFGFALESKEIRNHSLLLKVTK